MSLIAVTSNQPRHREFINRLESIVDLSLVLVLSKEPGDKKFVESENTFFNNFKSMNANVLECKPQHLNSSKLKSMLTSVDPEVFFVFGAPLLKEEFFSIPSRGCINIHTGLVQHHRGVDSSYWALYEEKPQTIGATLHYINGSIDGGNVIDQSKTTGIKIGDSPDDIFMKTCITGFDLLEKNMYNIIKNSVKSYPLKERGRLYQKKDMNFEKKLNIRYKTPIILKDYLNGNNS